MTNQILKNNIPKEILFELIDKICIKNNNYYIFNKISYKKGEYLCLYDNFKSKILNYYYKSKQYYVTRKTNYNSILTLIRHICKNNNISYTSKILYDKSSYEIIYYIFF
tara:strand:- start:1076 stop:1402 length:327 start_codon:yes stop_codon:yes gene_type:complete